MENQEVQKPKNKKVGIIIGVLLLLGLSLGGFLYFKQQQKKLSIQQRYQDMY